ncbi:respiratory burst oxidaseprotein C-like [Dorcoceras hygrometricum]|uniref:Respiratory burst oxidaseprotein C-like n=1 Tax=Dorcoceras hygrometricum TaxID=472368 RepID=A0A2Z7D2U2_9LAMI|nr:respiratory burst oxidaseprotein C-like [Dorcoceras hygrometricum]
MNDSKRVHFFVLAFLLMHEIINSTAGADKYSSHVIPRRLPEFFADSGDNVNSSSLKAVANCRGGRKRPLPTGHQKRGGLRRLSPPPPMVNRSPHYKIFPRFPPPPPTHLPSCSPFPPPPPPPPLC